MEDRLNLLIKRKRDKAKELNDTPSTSWKKRLRSYELSLIITQIKIERLKSQFK